MSSERVRPKAFALCMPFLRRRTATGISPRAVTFSSRWRRGFSQSGPSLHIAASATSGAHLESFTSHFILFHFNFPSSGSFFESRRLSRFLYLWSWSFIFPVSLLWSACRRDSLRAVGNDGSNLTSSPARVSLIPWSLILYLFFFVRTDFMHFHNLPFWPKQSDFSAIALLRLMAYLNSGQSELTLPSH